MPYLYEIGEEFGVSGTQVGSWMRTAGYTIHDRWCLEKGSQRGWVTPEDYERWSKVAVKDDDDDSCGDLLTLRQAAALAEKDECVVNRARQYGRLACEVNAAGQILFRRDEVEKWLGRRKPTDSQAVQTHLADTLTNAWFEHVATEYQAGDLTGLRRLYELLESKAVRVGDIAEFAYDKVPAGLFDAFVRQGWVKPPARSLPPMSVPEYREPTDTEGGVHQCRTSHIRGAYRR